MVLLKRYTALGSFFRLKFHKRRKSLLCCSIHIQESHGLAFLKGFFVWRELGAWPYQFVQYISQTGYPNDGDVPFILSRTRKAFSHFLPQWVHFAPQFLVMAVQAFQTARNGPGFLLGTVIACKWEIVSDWSRWPKEGSGGLWIRCVQKWFVRYPSMFSFGEVASRLKSFSCLHKIFNKLNFRGKISSLFRESLVIIFIILGHFESHQFYGLYCLVLMASSWSWTSSFFFEEKHLTK